jgi:hypothetical protein
MRAVIGKDWLRQVRLAKSYLLEATEMIGDVPDVQDRFILKRHFDAVAKRLEDNLVAGFSVSNESNDFAALIDLCEELIEDAVNFRNRI